MKFIRIGILLLLPLAAQAQTITLGPITKLAYCVGDTMLVPYAASGTFASDNHFFVQLSDASGSFASYAPIGNDAALNGSISVALNNVGSHFRVKVASTNPYDTSMRNADDIAVVAYPSPIPGTIAPRFKKLGPVGDNPFTKAIGLVGTDIRFADRAAEASGSTYSWTFGDGSTPTSSLTDSSVVRFAADGKKIGSITATNPTGCITVDSFKCFVLSCNPVIPRDAHIVTGDETGDYPSVWVKAGGRFTTTHFRTQFVYVEPAGVLAVGDNENGVYFVRAGASITSGITPEYLAAVLSPGMTISNYGNLEDFDTFYCPDLTFNYSELGVTSYNLPESQLSIHQSSNQLFARADAAESINLKLLNILGEEVLAKHGIGEIDLDLTSFQEGVYFAVAQAGNQHEVRRIAVVH
ncbi:MAG: T9SS type A sorting domain-containing protein [Bacteroidota bacterium]|nr:T9SS type A sorting domain-containing protein [Bacteroidota bacterium]MDP4233380.1 T9SS type A sorting domain-containing protein [Bacteroidota bacterium]MDP4242246.1 T9SS type A sorting domain-containing protein [Bacteroidota bacterium]MDP4287002.1 T9SS type A sorting domain-containing protein [Bacteroidota bacterium]